MKISAGNQAELAQVIHRDAGVPMALAEQFASAASCGQTVEFTVESKVIIHNGKDSFVLTLGGARWAAEADDTWDLEKTDSWEQNS